MLFYPFWARDELTLSALLLPTLFHQQRCLKSDTRVFNARTAVQPSPYKARGHGGANMKRAEPSQVDQSELGSDRICLHNAIAKMLRDYRCATTG